MTEIKFCDTNKPQVSLIFVQIVSQISLESINILILKTVWIRQFSSQNLQNVKIFIKKKNVSQFSSSLNFTSKISSRIKVQS